MLWIERASALLVPIGLSSQMSFDEELLDAAVDLFAKPRHLALRDVGHAHRLDQVVDGSRRDAVHVGFGSPRSWPCRRTARLEKRREIRALAKLRDCHRARCRRRVPLARACDKGVDVAASVGPKYARSAACNRCDQKRLRDVARRDVRGRFSGTFPREGAARLSPRSTSRHKRHLSAASLQSETVRGMRAGVE